MTFRISRTALSIFDLVLKSIGAPYRMTVAGGGRALARLGATPNGITATGLAVGVAGSALFIATRSIMLFAAMMLVGALLDALDGEVARRRGMETRVGSYFDAICDRFYEIAMIFAAAVVSGHWSLCFLLLGGSFCVSYAKARAALEAPTRNDAWPDLMERDRRLVAFLLALLAWALFPEARPLGRDLFFWALALLNIAVAITVVQRCRRALSLIRDFEKSPRHEISGHDPLGAP